MRDTPPPKNLHELRSFLGLTGYYRKFFWKYANVAEPLNKLTRSSKKWVWDNSQQKAFNTLKQSLITAPTLAFPNFEKLFTLYTDASSVGLGAVLSQFIDDKERVIAYWSNTLSKAQRNYSVTERESLAMTEAIKHFRYYLLGRKFQLVVDHHSLVFKMTDANDKLLKMAIRLQEYDFNVVY